MKVHNALWVTGDAINANRQEMNFNINDDHLPSDFSQVQNLSPVNTLPSHLLIA